MDGETYERWVAGFDVETGLAKGRLRDDEHAVRFVEVTVNGPKTWSLAAALHPEIADAYDAAQDRAAQEIMGWLAEHSTTRVGPRGRQVQIPVEEIEAAVVRHYTSRAGDPHRHLHLQINARVRAAGSWRGLHTVGVRDSLDAINGIGHAAVMTDPGFRAALAAHGYHLDPETAEIVELAGVRRLVQRTGTADRAEHRPVRGRVARRTSPTRNLGRHCGGPGIAAHGRTRGPTRSSPATASSWQRPGSRSCTCSGSDHRTARRRSRRPDRQARPERCCPGDTVPPRGAPLGLERRRCTWRGRAAHRPRRHRHGRAGAARTGRAPH